MKTKTMLSSTKTVKIAARNRFWNTSMEGAATAFVVLLGERINSNFL